MHTVFSTKDRRPLLRDAALRQELHHYLGGILKHLDCQPIIVGASQIEDVRRYIVEQEQHHRQLSFQDEFRLLLKRYELAYDERYVWD